MKKNFFVFQDRKLKLSASLWKRLSWNLTKFKTIFIFNFSIGCLIELKFCEVSWNSFSNRWWQFHLSILKNRKVLFLEKYELSQEWTGFNIKTTSFVYWPNFQWRFWSMYIRVKVSQFLMWFMKIYSNNTSNNLGEQNNVDYCSEVDRQTLHSERHSAEKKIHTKFI